MKVQQQLRTLAMLAGTALAMTALAVDNPEVEPNDTKAAATLADSGGVGMGPGDTITGTTTGVSTTTAGPASADYFRVRTALAPLAIYRYRLQLASITLGQTGTIRGLAQVAGVPTPGSDSTFQTSSTTTGLAIPTRTVQWYGFGRGDDIFYRVTGAGTTTASYTATLSRDVVVPQVVPDTILAGPITITTLAQGHTTDTDLWVYDSNLNPIPTFGNDDESVAGGGTGGTLQSLVTRPLTPGTYYVAISNFAFANNQAAAADDDFRTGTVLDFPNAAANSSATQNVNVTFSIVHQGGTVPVPSTRAGAFEVNWVQFTVVSPNFPIGQGAANPNPVVEGQTTLLTVEVDPAADGLATSHTVVADASGLGGSANLSLVDDGTSGDVAAGDNIFSANVIATTAPGPHNVSFTVTDNLSRSNSGSFTVTIDASATGACCSGTACSIDREFLCTSTGGTFQGAGTGCGGSYSFTLGGGGAFEDISTTGTPVSAAPGDDAIFLIDIGFTFNYFLAPFTQVGINTNGYLQFPPTSTATGSYQNVAIPTAAAPNVILAVLWDDFNFNVNANDSLTHELRGTAGTDLRHIFQWTNVAQFGRVAGDNEVNTFQAVLFEDGHVEYRYATLGNLGFESLTGNPGATVGVENAAGDVGVQYALSNAPVESNSNLRVDFVNESPCDVADPCDAADFNADGFLNPDDLTDVITCFFLEVQFPGACPDADFNGDLFVNPDDLTDYITLFFLCQ
jgi:hypothetical protein